MAAHKSVAKLKGQEGLRQQRTRHLKQQIMSHTAAGMAPGTPGEVEELASGFEQKQML